MVPILNNTFGILIFNTSQLKIIRVFEELNVPRFNLILYSTNCLDIRYCCYVYFLLLGFIFFLLFLYGALGGILSFACMLNVIVVFSGRYISCIFLAVNAPVSAIFRLSLSVTAA